MIAILSNQASVIQGMLDYAEEHFKYEEEWMRKHNFPKLKYNQHKQDHEFFAAKVKVYKSHFYMGTAVDGTEMMAFLKKWWRKHILKQMRNMHPI